jgi:lipoyl(octanoyl) transferase
MTAPLGVIDLGRRGYRDTLALQRELRLARLDGREPHDLLLLVEHEPTYTLGRGTRQSSLPLAPALLEARGATVVDVERGGDVTWHGPGQLVGYPILDLRTHREDLHWYLRELEGALCDALATADITACADPGRTGVWTGGRKIASIGVHVKQWVTLHGFALNIDPDLSWFEAIVPCGLHGVTMTSIARERGGTRATWWEPMRAAVIGALGRRFDRVPHEREAVVTSDA